MFSPTLEVIRLLNLSRCFRLNVRLTTDQRNCWTKKNLYIFSHKPNYGFHTVCLCATSRIVSALWLVMVEGDEWQRILRSLQSLRAYQRLSLDRRPASTSNQCARNINRKTRHNRKHANLDAKRSESNQLSWPSEQPVAGRGADMCATSVVVLRADSLAVTCTRHVRNQHFQLRISEQYQY